MLATTFQLFPSPFQDFFAIYLLKQNKNTSSENNPHGANSESYIVNKKCILSNRSGAEPVERGHSQGSACLFYMPPGLILKNDSSPGLSAMSCMWSSFNSQRKTRCTTSL